MRYSPAWPLNGAGASVGAGTEPQSGKGGGEMVVKRKLGRGLQSLLGIEDPVAVSQPHESAEAHVPSADRDVDRLPLDQIDPNPFQPRQDFDPEDLAALVRSIRLHGVIQPILVRPLAGRYQLVAGERRLRAAHDAGLADIPARVVELDDQTACELALVENLQRNDLNPLEKGRAFESYLARYGATHEQLAEHIGVDRSTVTNFVRLLELPQPVQQDLQAGKITFGHARALLSLADPVAQIAACRRIVAEGLTVRQTEALSHVERKRKPGHTPAAVNKTNHLRSLEDALRRKFGAKVEITLKGKDKGVLAVHFESNDDFERIIGQLLGDASASS
jgi:ParB family chromosome partitioning protein